MLCANQSAAERSAVMYRVTARCAILSVIAVAITAPPTVAGGDPFADTVVSYDSGVDVAPFNDPATALGPPERFTGEGVFPTVVSVFSSPFNPDEIVSIGAGGHLTVSFDEPVTDDPDNLYGVDLIVFGNALLIDPSFTDGVCSAPCGIFADPGTIEVSEDGTTWFTVPDVVADDLYPGQGYMDSGPYDTTPGTELTDFTQPVDPRLTLSDFDDADLPTMLDLYFGSAGGAGIDIASVGLSEVSFVRISSPVGSLVSPEIDAIVDAAPRLRGDANLSGAVNIDDLLLVINSFGIDPPGGPAPDVNDSGLVNFDDVIEVIQNWTGS